MIFLMDGMQAFPSTTHRTVPCLSLKASYVLFLFFTASPADLGSGIETPLMALKMLLRACGLEDCIKYKPGSYYHIWLGKLKPLSFYSLDSF